MRDKFLNNMFTAIILFVSCSISVANAGLIDRGNGMIYDDVLNITWLQDANLAGGTGNNWDLSTAWASNLSYGGYNDWRLPTVFTLDGCFYSTIGNTDCGYNVLTTHSELAYMFHVNLGNVSLYDTNGITNQVGWDSLNTSFTDVITNNTVSFTNLNRNGYWSGNSGLNYSTAWLFNTFSGYQGTGNKNNNYYAWAVRNGDVAAVNVAPVPEPTTLTIFGLGLIGLLTQKRLIKRKLKN